jgi:hypothetical protein
MTVAEGPAVSIVHNEGGGSMFLRNVGTYVHEYTYIATAQTAILMFPAFISLRLSKDERQSSHKNETTSKLIVLPILNFKLMARREENYS